MTQVTTIINQLFDIQQKIEQEQLSEKFDRNFNRLYLLLEEEGYICQNPLGERYTASRLDCEANIIGHEGKEMTITQVIKPIIYKKSDTGLSLIQKAVVMVAKK
jgi:hypothetical protein